MVNRNSKIRERTKKNVLFPKKTFLADLRWFLPLSKTVNAQNGRWKQMFQINSDVANNYLLVPLCKRSSWLTLVQEADSASFWIFPKCVKTKLITTTTTTGVCRAVGEQSIIRSHLYNVAATLDGKQQQNAPMICFWSATSTSTVYFSHV